jgi:predicted secreted protein
MTTGEKLKIKLGLSKIQNVSICRVIVSSFPIYLVYYSSSSPNMPITTYRVRNSNVANIFNGADVEHNRSGKQKNIIPLCAPLMPIEQYAGNMGGIWFITIDLAGFQLINQNLIENKKNILYFNRLMEITLFDLKQADITSDLTKKYKGIRKKINKTANYNSKLITCEIENNDVLFKYLTEATDNDDISKKNVNPQSLSLENNPSKTYEIWLKFPNSLDLLNLQDKETIDRKTVKSLIEISDVLIWDSNPSWQFQGFNFWNSQLGSSLFPTDIAPKVWNADNRHGNGVFFLPKHLSQLIDQISFFLNPMASMLDKALRDGGYLPSRKK